MPLKQRLGTIPSKGSLIMGGEDNFEPEMTEQKPVE
jgi:hypothetical protein